MPRPYLQRTTAIFRVLQDRELRALWFADWINDVGNFVTFIALAVYINNLTGTATAVGLGLALRSVPSFTIGAFAGILVDGLERRAVAAATSLLRPVLEGALLLPPVAGPPFLFAFCHSQFH